MSTGIEHVEMEDSGALWVWHVTIKSALKDLNQVTKVTWLCVDARMWSVKTGL